MDPDNKSISKLIIKFANINFSDFTFSETDYSSKGNSQDFAFNDDDKNSDNFSLKEFTLQDYAKELNLNMFLESNAPLSKSAIILMDSKGVIAQRDKNKENEEGSKIVKKVKSDCGSK